jgi:hypothetical protein
MVKLGVNAITSKHANKNPRCPSIGLTVASIGTSPIKQAP